MLIVKYTTWLLISVYIFYIPKIKIISGLWIAIDVWNALYICHSLETNYLLLLNIIILNIKNLFDNNDKYDN